MTKAPLIDLEKIAEGSPAISKAAQALQSRVLRLGVTQAAQLLGVKEEDAKNPKIPLKNLIRNSPTGKHAGVGSETNTANRPFRPTLASRYAQQILNKQWELNGEPWILDANGAFVSAQHRCAALILAWRLWNAGEGGQWGRTAPYIETFIVNGVSPKSADTVDLGQRRTGGDVLFRRAEFDSDQYTDAQMKKLSNDLAVALRLVWLRSQGYEVSSAVKLEHPDMVSLLEEHPGIKECVRLAYRLDCQSPDPDHAADGEGHKNIKATISRGYFAALLYLFACKDSTDLQPTKEGMKAANVFGEIYATPILAQDAEKQDVTIITLREYLSKQAIDLGSGPARDAFVGLWVKTMVEWSNSQVHKSVKHLRPKTNRQKQLVEFPKFGGLDMTTEEYNEYYGLTEEPTTEEPTAKNPDPANQAQAEEEVLI